MARTSRKQEILDAAIDLFAEHGVDAVSLREVNAAANMSSAALHYHFKNRDMLISSLIEPIIQGYVEVRTQHLDELRMNPSILSMERVINALVRSLSSGIAKNPEQGLKELRLFAHLYSDASDHLENIFETTWRAYAPLLIQLLPDVDEHEIKLRLSFAADLSVQGIVKNNKILKDISTNENFKEIFEDYLQSLIQFIAAAVQSSKGAFQSSIAECPQESFNLRAAGGL